MIKRTINIFTLSAILLGSAGVIGCASNTNSKQEEESTLSEGINANDSNSTVSNSPSSLEIDPNLHTVDTIPADFVLLNEVIPDIIYDLKYAGNDNFTGKPVPGYDKPLAYVTSEVATRLAALQQELRSNGVGLKVFDAYRPHRAVNSFITWAKDTEDRKMKSAFYPDYQKEDLFKNGFIATKSNHSRGVAIDLTVVMWDTKEEIDMGTPFDFFGKLSNHDAEGLTKQQAANRNHLRSMMLKYGFEPYSQEWWHYTLPTNLHEGTYYDFPLQ